MNSIINDAVASGIQRAINYFEVLENECVKQLRKDPSCEATGQLADFYRIKQNELFTEKRKVINRGYFD